MIEVMFAIRKDGFKDHPVIPEGLDLVDEDDQFTHMLPLDDDYNLEDVLSKTPEPDADGGDDVNPNLCVCFLSQMCLSWTPTSWKMRRNIKL